MTGIVYITQELSAARVQLERVKDYLSKGQQLIEESAKRDHFFEVAGHILVGLPDAIMLCAKAIDATALAVSRLDYDELSQSLLPEKVETLETALNNARIRQIPHRSQGETPVMDSKTAAARLNMIACAIDATGQVPVVELAETLQALTPGLPPAAPVEERRTAGGKASSTLRKMASYLATQAKPSRTLLVDGLRVLMAQSMETMGQSNLASAYMSASSREEVIKGFKSANPSLTDDQLNEIADQWEKNKDQLKG